MILGIEIVEHNWLTTFCHLYYKIIAKGSILTRFVHFLQEWAHFQGNGYCDGTAGKEAFSSGSISL